MLIPDPTDLISSVVLVFSKPKLSLLANHIKDLCTIISIVSDSRNYG